MSARNNPFATHRLEALPYRAPGFDGDKLLTQLEHGRMRGALVGPKGTGKTTLLLELRERLLAEGLHVDLIRYSTDPALKFSLRHLPPRPAADSILLIDGAEQIPALAWQLIRLRFRHAAGLIITTHRPGRLPTLWECQSSPALLKELVKELIPHSDPGKNLESLYQTHGGNLREALLELYDESAKTTQYHP